MNKDHKNGNQNKHRTGKKNIFVRFKDFITRGNIVSFGVAIIIGNAFSDVINGFVDNIIVPFISLILGKVDLTQLKWVISSDVSIMYGKFIQAGINFFVIALCIFIFCILIGQNPDTIQTKEEAQKAQGEKTNELLEEIRDALKNNS